MLVLKCGYVDLKKRGTHCGVASVGILMLVAEQAGVNRGAGNVRCSDTRITVVTFQMASNGMN